MGLHVQYRRVVGVDHAGWLAQVSEPVLDPELPICDPHHHLWDHPTNRYLLDEVIADVGTGHRVVSTVFVECNSMYRSAGDRKLAPVGETEFVQGIAAMSASGAYGQTRIASGIVGFADLTLGDHVRTVLEAHVAASPNRFRGIRHAAGWFADDSIRNSHTDPPEELYLREDFRTGMAVLADMGLVFDAWLYHYQLPDFVDLARAFPEVTFVLDHFGGPLGIGPYSGRQREVFDEWCTHVSELKPLTNVHFKLGGINMKLNGFDWHRRDVPPTSDELVEATAPYYDHCIDTFGADRCMFESNFPVDKDSCSYGVLWNAFKKMAVGRSPEEKSQLFCDTASRVYSLNADF